MSNSITYNAIQRKFKIRGKQAITWKLFRFIHKLENMAKFYAFKIKMVNDDGENVDCFAFYDALFFGEYK